MEHALVKAFLEALAVGDAFGKATEYCTQREVESRLPSVTRLLKPEESLAHTDLEWGRVTDDTEQNLYLIREYARKKRVDPHDTAECLLRWSEETDAARYMGPSSKKALIAIREGADITQTGLNGTTCGGMMRTPAAFLFRTPDTLEKNITACLMPTHYTAAAMEAAMCYAYALQAAAGGEDMEGILRCACDGAERGRAYGSSLRVAGVAPSCAARIRYLQRVRKELTDDRAVKDFLYQVLGATLASCDVCACVFGLFMYAEKDVFLAVRLATEMGGDTDTIACLAAGLCTLYAGGHNLDPDMVRLVAEANAIDFDAAAALCRP